MSAKRAALTAVAAGLILCGRLRAAADADSAASRVDALLARMSLSEKIALLHGVPEPAATDQGQAGYLAGLARLGIAPLRLAHGPPGVLARYPSTGLTATNPNTIVVLNLSQPVALPWLDRVKAVLLMWYPGDEGGPATASLLLGRVRPAGRLPLTWPRRLEDGLANDPMHPERSSAGVDGRSTFSEGIFIGYRCFDRQGLEPLYPFGYGLSYTSFEYRDLALAAAADGGLDASFTLRNVGPAAGDEVPQVYLGPPQPAPRGAQFAHRALVGPR
jgi:hypothetical protein